MVNVVFIILHYKIFDVTSKCIRSLLHLNQIENCRIIVYDNGSNNGSFEQLKQHFSRCPQVEIYKSDTNLGFSTGNNRAYKIAKSYNPKFIVTLNNDVVIKQSDFISRLTNIYDKHGFFVLGPDIYIPYQEIHQNPFYIEYPSLDQLDKEIEVYRNNLADRKSEQKREQIKRYKNAIRRYIPSYLLHIFRTLKVRLKLLDFREKNYKNMLTNPVLHGACLIFSQLYIDENDKLFEPETKFYYEELLLALKCKTLGYSVIYTPELQVLHYHEVSTKKSTKTVEQYLLFQAQNMLDSFEILEKALKENPWQKNH